MSARGDRGRGARDDDADEAGIDRARTPQSAHRADANGDPHAQTPTMQNQHGEAYPTRFQWTYAGANNVHLCGSFTNWLETVPMACETHGDGNRVFTVMCDLPPGYHQYKFIVDGQWRHDENQAFIQDPLGNVNNWLYVKPAGGATPPLATVAVAIAAYAVARAVFVERRYAEALVSPREAADADGEFLDVDGVEVHYKRARRANAKRFIECMHGFGANASSWTTSDTMRRASEALDAEVVAHDSCGFGLTARPRDVKKYTRASDAKACRAIAREVGGDAAARSLTLMGHSLGAVGAALAAAQGGVDYVVLVAPAIIGGKLRKNDAGDDAALSLPTFVRVAFAAVGAAAATAAWCLTCAVKPFLILLLRKLVRSKEFWTKGLRAAIDPSRVDAMASDWIDGYRKPSVVRDWDVGMFRVVLASVVAASSPREIWRDAMARARATTQPSTLEREDAVNALVESGAKILIVHGENDVIVPASNSRTLAKLLNCELRILPKCGHMPHEESPEAFIDVLRDFIS